MTFDCLHGKGDIKGVSVKIVEYDDDTVHIGKIEFFNPDSGKLGVRLENATQLQMFYERDVECCEIVNQTQKSDDEEAMRHVFRKAESENPRMKSKWFVDADNKHLRNLHRIEMEKLLCGSPPEATEPMATFEDVHGLQYYQLPAVNQTSQPRCSNVNNQEVHGGYVEMMIREKLWKKSNEEKIYPTLVTPSKLYVVDKLDNIFSHAISVIVNCSTIGFSCEGKNLGRNGVLSWIVISTEDEVFVFDIIELQQDAFKFGLKTVIQDKNITKVVHDVRFIHDCLLHQYGVKLEKVYDTMIGDVVFCNQNVYRGFLPAYNRSLVSLLRNYLGIEDFHIFYPRYRRTHLNEDSEVWMQRPSSEYLLLGAARNCLYLQSLFKIIRKGNFLAFHQSCAVLKDSIKSKDAPDAVQAYADIEQVPKDVLSVFPNWEQDSNLNKISPIDGKYIHQNISNQDPLLIFSKDSMHQSRYIGK